MEQKPILRIFYFVLSIEINFFMQPVGKLKSSTVNNKQRCYFANFLKHLLLRFLATLPPKRDFRNKGWQFFSILLYCSAHQ